MKYDHSIHLALLLATIAMLCSCVTRNQSYWVRTNLVEGVDTHADDWAIIPSEIDQLPDEDYKRFRKVSKEQAAGKRQRYYRNLRIIEYDDYGDKWESRQTQSAVDLIHVSPRDTDVIVFCHGWKNNAKPDNGDLADFNRFMINFGKGENKNAIGIYIGWRGASVRTDYGVGPLDALAQVPATFTFMDRRAATSRVAGIPLETDLWKIRKAAVERNCRVILVGHSFGARVLERVVSPSLVSANAQKDYLSQFEGVDKSTLKRNLQIADLVVLVNPATEALHTRQMMLSLRNWPADTPPVVISLLSDSDVANRWIWKTGKSADRLLTSTVPLQDRDYKLGHHRSKNLFRKVKTESQWNYVNSTPADNKNLRVAHISLTKDKSDWKFDRVFENSKGVSAKAFATFQLSSEILDGHTGLAGNFGIFTPELERVVRDIFQSTSSSGSYKGSKLQKVIAAYGSENN